MRHVVVSAINLYAAGPLTIAREFLSAARDSAAFRRGEYRITAFVHKASLFNDLRADGITYIEKPASRKNWLIRLFYEYVWFNRWSATQNVDTWVSLHDVSPNVKARRRMVYCHNPAIFYNGKSTLWTWRNDPNFELFRLFYARLYAANLHKNDHVIVQQQWIRDEFAARFDYPPERIIVARPDAIRPTQPPPAPNPSPSQGVTLIYPAFPRFFKNHEVLVEAMKIIAAQPPPAGEVNLELTMSGQENGYAKKIVGMAAGLRDIRFVGFLSHAQTLARYAHADAMIFPSKLETWGLPLSEFRETGKPIFAADLPYAKEPLNDYPGVEWFDPDDAPALAERLRRFAQTRQVEAAPVHVEIKEPRADHWVELLRQLDLA